MTTIQELIAAKNADLKPAAAEKPTPVPQSAPPEPEFLELVEMVRIAVNALGDAHRRLKALPKRQRSVHGLSSMDPIRLAATIVRAETADFDAQEKAFAHPKQGWEPKPAKPRTVRRVG
jgi:hypothetical protein